MTELPSEEDLLSQVMLTSSLVWGGRIERGDVDEWLNNFKGHVKSVGYERRIALWLLTNFVFFNEGEVRHLCKTAFRDFARNELNNCEQNNLDAERMMLLDGTRFRPLGEPGESGAFLLYYFRQENRLPIRYFYSPEKKSHSSLKRLVYFDDVTLSTGQNSQAFGKLKHTKARYPGVKVIVVTLIATENAKNFLQSNGISVVSAITLKSRDKAFSDDSIIFGRYERYLKDAKEIAESYGKALFDPPLGFSDCQLIIGFFYNTPDNTLPIIWSDDNSWTPIFRRYPKIYSNEPIQLGRFV